MNGMNNFMGNPYMARTSNNSINWVQGVEGAKAYNLLPTESVVLMDSESDDTFFIKLCDNIGRCTLRTFKYTEVTEKMSNNIDLSEYVKKSDLAGYVNELLGGKNE